MRAGSAAATLRRPTAVAFLGTLAIGVPLPVLPQYVDGPLGYGPVVVGIVMGAQSAATLVTRAAAGRLSDRDNPRRAVLFGLGACSVAGLCYCLAATLAGGAALAMLLAGRAVLGLGESLVITGSMALGIQLAGPARAGLVIVWVGIALFGAFGLGAPVGNALYHAAGFGPVAALACAVPLAGLALGWGLPATTPVPGLSTPLGTVLRWVTPAGACLALSGLGYAAIISFLPLLLAARGWGGAGLALSAFAGGFILARLAFGAWPDRYGGRRVALGSLAVELVGQVLLWRAPSLTAAAVGAGLTGAGYSIAFPSLGIEAIRRVPPQNRGVALGIYVAFLDVALGAGAPALGVLVSLAGYPAAFGMGAAACALAIAATWRLPARLAVGQT